jgi:hypothetical protein
MRIADIYSLKVQQVNAVIDYSLSQDEAGRGWVGLDVFPGAPSQDPLNV